MNVLSLFDGMSCGQIALKELGINVEKYYASEIDKFAIQQTQHNFKDTIQLGSVTEVKAKEIDKIDLLIGGSPCQGFSFAGKQLNFNDERSKLFFEYVRLWNEIKAINPNAKFLLENVNMKKEYLRVISEYMGVYPVRINSNLVSAQNRDRWYWTNIRTKETGLFSELWSDIPQPKDRGILLKDVLQPESEVDEKYYLSDKLFTGLLKHADKRGQEFQTHAGNDKAKCITVSHQKQNLDSNYVCVAMRGRNPENPNERQPGATTEQRLEPKMNGKTNCLTSVSKDNLILSCDYRRDEGLRIKKNGKTGSLLARARNDESCGQLAIQNYKLRRLTPLECSRLQTVPEWYEWIVSDTQTYKMLGNGWTIEVIKHIFSFLNT